MNLLNRVEALKNDSGVVAVHLYDVKEGRVTLPEALVRMIEDLVGVNRRLLERLNKLPRTDDISLADAIMDAILESNLSEVYDDQDHFNLSNSDL